MAHSPLNFRVLYPKEKHGTSLRETFKTQDGLSATERRNILCFLVIRQLRTHSALSRDQKFFELATQRISRPSAPLRLGFSSLSGAVKAVDFWTGLQPACDLDLKTAVFIFIRHSFIYTLNFNVVICPLELVFRWRTRFSIRKILMACTSFSSSLWMLSFPGLFNSQNFCSLQILVFVFDVVTDLGEGEKFEKKTRVNIPCSSYGRLSVRYLSAFEWFTRQTRRPFSVRIILLFLHRSCYRLTPPPPLFLRL